MAAYSIVLNLSGNAVTRVEKLASALASANVSATLLANSLRSVAGSAVMIPRTPIRVPTARTVGTTYAARRVADTEPNYTRHRYTRIASYGTGFNVGGFSGRLSTIIQPDSNGNILGLNAASLSRNLNIAGIVGSLLTSVGKIALKTVAAATVAPIAIGGGGIMLALRALQSESFAQGVRLIARRRQAQLGLGVDYERAQSSADFLAASYGLDRSGSLSSINVLSGLGVGGTGRKLTMGEATGLTKIGGLISQQAGVPFERVMTNIQQLLVQETPHIRDIRELLNQAPILGKYAIRDMETQGIKGVDVRTYLKDQANLLSVLKSYELDNASNAGMQARGRIALAQQDAWANVASNDPAWRYIGQAGANLIRSIGTGVNNLLTTLTNNQSFQVMVKNVELFFDSLGTKGVTLVDKLISLIDGLAAKYGIDMGNVTAARQAVDTNNAIASAVGSPRIQEQLWALWNEMGAGSLYKPGVSRREFDRWVQNDLLTNLQSDTTLTSLVKPVGELSAESTTGFLKKLAAEASPLGLSGLLDMSNKLARVQASDSLPGAFGQGNAVFFTRWRNNQEPTSAYAGYQTPESAIVDRATAQLKELLSVGTLDPSHFRSGAAMGEELSGFNKDRRALTINFNSPIVQWENTMYTNDPVAVTDEVAENIELIASAAIQKALLGSTQKLGSRWY